MNLEFLQEKIDIFTREVINSGFMRDLDDYITSLPTVQNNIISLREIASKVLSTLDILYGGDLPDAMAPLFPDKKYKTFIDSPHNVNLKTIIDNTQIQQQDFFNQLNQQLANLKKQIQSDKGKIDNIHTFIAPYMVRDITALSEQGHAIISVSFKDATIISNLPRFTKTISEWNMVLPIYHQLLLSTPPKDIGIVELQNGSIDLILNVNVDVGLSLVQLFEIGFKCYAAYLLYKKLAKPIIDTYYGNPKLIESEKEREKQLIDNISIAIEAKIHDQHDKAIKNDKNIETTSIEGKIRETKRLVVSHIIMGNDIKLLAVPKSDDKTQEPKQQKISEDLRKASAEVRSNLRFISSEDKQKLLDKYSDSGESPKTR